MLLVEDVHKSYRSRGVLRGVDLAVPAGRIVGLIGSNGAGKTTLISIATGLITADGGRVLLGEGDAADVDVAKDRRRAAGLIGLAPQELGVYPMLSVEQNLVTFAELAGLRRGAARAQVERVVEALDLVPQLRQRADTLSGGQARRLHTGMALMHRPAVLFLDEPTVGADVAARLAILDVVRDIAAQGTSVVYTTHYLGELSDLDAHVAILHQGRIALEGSVKEVVDAHAAPSLGIVTSGERPMLPGWEPTAAPEGATLPAGSVRWNAPSEALKTGQAAVLADALGRLGTATTLEGVDVTPASLETAFLAITGRHLTGSEDVANEFANDFAVEEAADVAHA
jgi:ABC-2 type transport system ATP-binding protein